MDKKRKISHGEFEVGRDQWQPVAFKMREDDYFFSITAYWMTVIHIPFTQPNVTSIGLG